MEILRQLENLTPEEEAICEQVKQKYLDIALKQRPPLNKPLAKQFVHWLYKHAGVKIPKVIFADSTLSAQVIAKYLDKKVWFKFLRSEKNLQKKSDDHIAKKGIHTIDKFDYNFSDYGNIGDFGWMAFFDFTDQIDAIRNPEYKEYDFFKDTGIYDMIQFDKVCIVCQFPTDINLDEQNRLHAEDKPAIQWKDGYKKYFWKGVRVNEKIITHPETITKEDIVKETNAEIRRCIQEKLGNEQFANLLGLIELHKNIDKQGNEQILFETKEVDEIAGVKMKYARFICPTSQRRYFIPVPPDMTDIDEAKAWTMYRTKATYNPTIET